MVVENGRLGFGPSAPFYDQDGNVAVSTGPYYWYYEPETQNWGGPIDIPVEGGGVAGLRLSRPQGYRHVSLRLGCVAHQKPAPQPAGMALPRAWWLVCRGRVVAAHARNLPRRLHGGRENDDQNSRVHRSVKDIA